MNIVELKKIEKKLRKVPKDIIRRLQRWILYVQTVGLMETRKIPGLHDEPLKGTWRAIYKHEKDGKVHIAAA